jgi:hypothetical protein
MLLLFLVIVSLNLMLALYGNSLKSTDSKNKLTTTEYWIVVSLLLWDFLLIASQINLI